MWPKHAPAICVLLLVTVVSSAFKYFPSEKKANCSMRPVQLRVKHKNCLPVKLYARACSGACASYTAASASDPTHLETKCDCCQYVGRKRKRFGIKCPSSKQKNHFKVVIFSITLPKRCSCRPCSSAPTNVISAERSLLQASPILSDSLKATLKQIFMYFK